MATVCIFVIITGTEWASYLLNLTTLHSSHKRQFDQTGSENNNKKQQL